MDTTTVETVASVEVQENMMPEISAIKAVSGGSPVVTVLLAVIVMFGGPAAWKFWTARQKAKTELEERRLELDAKIELAKIKADSDDEKEVKKTRKTKKNTKGESSKEKP